jgi:hypothetical protein
MDFVQSIEAPDDHSSFFTLNHRRAVLSQLELKVDSLYRDFGRVFQPEQAPMLFSSVEPRYDEQTKSNTIEFSTTTPLDCPGRAVCDALWSFLEQESVREDTGGLPVLPSDALALRSAAAQRTRCTRK